MYISVKGSQIEIEKVLMNEYAEPNFLNNFQLIINITDYYLYGHHKNILQFAIPIIIVKINVFQLFASDFI